MSTNIELKNKIMRRVRRVYYLQQILSPLLLKVYGLVIMFIGAVSLVSLKNVVVNLSNVETFGQFYSFMSAAFFNTELVVQALVLIILLLVALMIRDIIKNPVGLSHQKKLLHG